MIIGTIIIGDISKPVNIIRKYDYELVFKLLCAQVLIFFFFFIFRLLTNRK